MSVSGRGSRHVCSEWLSDDQPTIACTSLIGKEHGYGLCRLISTFEGSSTIAVDFKRRPEPALAMPGPPFGSIGQAHIPLRDKFQLFQSLVLSCLFFGTGTWSAPKVKELAPLVRCYHSMCRSMLRRHYKGDVQRVTDDRVRASVYVPWFEAWLHFNRLSYLASFVVLDIKEDGL